MSSAISRRRFHLRGQVQGVGFRPFVYRLATEFELGGEVSNDDNGAVIEVEGPRPSIDTFAAALIERLPPLARISDLQQSDVEPAGQTAFRIGTSRSGSSAKPEVTPDAATCPDCLAELLHTNDRRHNYPFINCTNCGPRYSIIRTVPYDRPATTMAEFTMCPPCQDEYDDPADRRFHAQPNACPACGPQLALYAADLSPLGGDPIGTAARLLADGRILAVKGIGGYHLACRADAEDVVASLRRRKLRDGKPLAVMVRDVEAAQRLCRLSADDLSALTSPAAPILLAPKKEGHALAPSIAPGCGDFGLMLPYAPVHHLLFGQNLGPLVMTSANLAGDPLTYEDDDAFEALGDVADGFLIHNRRIFRPIDDSVVYTFRGEITPLRRARGYAPQPLRLSFGTNDRTSDTKTTSDRRVLAVGGELKSTVCLLFGGEAIISEHLGELTRPATYRHFTRAIDRLRNLYEFSPDVVAHDLHPRYLSTEYAERLGIPAVSVQHHHAHIVSVLAEWGEPGPVIGLSCDGTGYGTDGAVWGCEVLRCTPGSFTRLGHLEYFPLVGGDAAAIETWRPAAALLHQAVGQDWLERCGPLFQATAPQELEMFYQQLSAGINSPASSSLGRVFDAVAFILGLCGRNRHEAEAAMALESVAAGDSAEPYPCELTATDGMLELPIGPAVVDLLTDALAGRPVSLLAARFHETVSHLLARAAAAACELSGLTTVAISGGCFANRRLAGRLVDLLESAGLRVIYNRRVPCGDGGVSLGQAVAASWIANGDETGF